MLHIFTLNYFNPLINGIRQISETIPTIPTTIPITISFHTIVRHIPTPSNNEPTIPINIATIVFPEGLINAFFPF